MDTIEDIIYRAIEQGIKEELMIEVGEEICKHPHRSLYGILPVS